VHDIRLRFEVSGIWIFLSTYHSDLPTNHNNKDILIPAYNIDGLLVRVAVHRTDTVSVILACSLDPVSADIGGVIRLSDVLARVEERLATLLASRFGVDSLTEYSGDKFSCTWEVGRGILVRAYTKTTRENKTRIRLERQEYPTKTLQEAVEEKINIGGCSSL
jgi:hypothetical protein